MDGVAMLGSLTMVLMLVALFVLVLWVLLPFAVFGSKPLLRELLAEQKQTNELLRSIRAHAVEQGQTVPPPPLQPATPTVRPSVWRTGRAGADRDEGSAGP
jgi:hypothetical protein